jgi:predicted metal-dependent phosphoesterase TrpH
MKADLHLHSTASDGRLSPEDVVQTAAHLGLAIISLTDHDSVDGIASAL